VDSTITFHYMPKQYITWWTEAGYRTRISYFSGEAESRLRREHRFALTVRLRWRGSAGTATSRRHTRIAADPAACGSRIFASQFTVSAGVMVKF